MTSTRRTKPGFTLVEVLVVVGVIAILISLLLPALSKARQTARQIQCLSNVRQIAAANLMYASDNKGSLPALIFDGSNWPIGYTFFLRGSPSHKIITDLATPGIHNPWPQGAGILLYKGYLTDLRVCFCPGRLSEDIWGYEGQAAPQQTSLTDGTTWNPGVWNGGWPGGAANGDLQGGYIWATGDTVWGGNAGANANSGTAEVQLGIGSQGGSGRLGHAHGHGHLLGRVDRKLLEKRRHPQLRSQHGSLLRVVRWLCPDPAGQ